MTNPEWKGRVDFEDGSDGLRWHQCVQPWSPGSKPGTTLVGFAVDEGVRRNQGRVGAMDGPGALRRSLSNLPHFSDQPIWDAGDITCEHGDLELSQSVFAKLVSELRRAGHRIIGMGGGHEIGYASFRGMVDSIDDISQKRIGILNFDAHFDLRKAVVSHSGNSFTQALKHAHDLDYSLEYRVLGISESSNTRALFQEASKQHVWWKSDREFKSSELPQIAEEITNWIDSLDALYLTVCLDVLAPCYAPGVSAPSTRGISFDTLEDLLTPVAKGKKLMVADVAELNPRFDIDHRTARSAARLVWCLSGETAPQMNLEPEGL